MQQQLSNSMVSSAALKELKQYQQKFSYIQNLMNHLKVPKKTILLIQNKTIQQEKLNMIASFTLGVPFKINKSTKNYEYDSSNLDIAKYSFCSVNVCIVQKSSNEKDKNMRDHRVIYLSHQTKNSFINLSQFYFITKLLVQQIRRYPNADQGNNLLVYAVIEEEDKLEEVCKHYCINQNIANQLNQICIQAFQEDLSNPRKIQIQKDFNEHILPQSIKLFDSHNKNKKKQFLPQFKELSKKKFEKKDMLDLQKYRLSIQKLCVRLLTPITNVMALVVNKKQKQINQPFYYYFKDFEMFLSSNDLQFQLPDAQKLDQQLAYKSLVLRVLGLLEKYKNLRSKQNLDKIKQWLCSFFEELSKQLSLLPCIKQQQQKIFIKISQVLINQLNLLNQASSEYLSPQLQILQNELKIKDEKKNRLQQSLIRLKVFESTVNISVRELADLKYYDDFSQLLKKSQIGFSLNNLANRQALTKNKNALNEKLPKSKLNAALNGESLNRDENERRIRSISDFFIRMFPELKKKNVDWKVLVILFKKSAHIMKNNGFPELALQLFKKIRFQNEVESCIRDTILKFQYRNEERSNKYLQTAQYFEQNGRLQKAAQYAEKAYQNFPENTQYIKYLMNTKKRMYTYQTDKASLASINSLSHEKLDDFYNYQFKEELIQKFQRAAEEYKKFDDNFCSTYTSSQSFNFSFQMMNL